MELFLNFFKPLLDKINNSSFFKYIFDKIFMLLSGVSILIPFYLLYMMIEKEIFNAQGKFTITFLLLWLGILLASWLGFQIWWHSRSLINKDDESNDKYITPLFSLLIKTLGEWLGFSIGIVGGWFALIGTLILGDDAGMLIRALGLGSILNVGYSFIIIMPIIGVLIIAAFRFVSELVDSLIKVVISINRIELNTNNKIKEENV